jgi:hypothetical protein
VSPTPHDVKHLSLAAAGRLRIDWVPLAALDAGPF